MISVLLSRIILISRHLSLSVFLLCFVYWCGFIALMSERWYVRWRESVVVVWSMYVLCIMLFSKRHSRNGHVNYKRNQNISNKCKNSPLLTATNNPVQLLPTTIEMVKSACASMEHFLHHLDPDKKNNKKTWRFLLEDLKRKILDSLPPNILWPQLAS